MRHLKKRFPQHHLKFPQRWRGGATSEVANQAKGGGNLGQWRWQITVPPNPFIR
jgi:hypothetical protein